MKSYLLASLIAISLVLSIGCSSGGSGVTSPESGARTDAYAGSHQLWGLWRFEADPAAMTLDAVPLRDAAMHINVLPFLEPPASVNLTLDSLQFNGDQITADIGLRHPFLGLTKFTGFDVCGIFITSGSVSGFDDAALVMPGDGDTRLLNPDGYTRWWNPAEFPVNTGTMFAYNDGLLGAPDSVGNFNCTLNGYKYYTDGLGATDGLDEADPGARGIFSAGQKNVRRFIIQMDAGLVFNYAIDANWQFPQGAPPFSAPDDFPPAANRPEPWRVEITELANSLWNDGNSSGGNLSLSFDVYDHFNAGMNTVIAESAGSFAPTASGAPSGGGAGYSTYEIDITGATPAAGSIDILITVESDVDGYGGLLPGETVSSYLTYTTDVSSNPPFEGVYVDGDNSSDPLEDGSTSHPFNTIQEGINAAGSGSFTDIWDVYVDPYEGGDYALFSLANDVNLTGYAWNAGGNEKPEVILTGAHTFAQNVSNSTMANFLVTFNHTASTGGEITYFYAVDSTYLTIEDCKFTGIGSAQTCSFFNFTRCDNLLVEHNEFVDFRNKSNYPGNMLTWFMRIIGCDDSMIRHNEFHDIGFDDEGDNTTYNNTSTYLWHPGPDGSDQPDNLSIINNLVYDIKDYSNSVAVGYKYNYITILSLPGGTTPPTNFVVANNTVDDMTEVAMGDPAVGAAKFCYGYNIGGDWTFKNTILSNWNPFSGAENGHRGFWADGSVFCTVTYSNVYNIGPVGHPQVRDYVNRMLAGAGCFLLTDYQDPAYDMTPGEDYYHVTNSLLLSDDGTEMGAFGGPDGDWLASSQE